MLGVVAGAIALSLIIVGQALAAPGITLTKTTKDGLAQGDGLRILSGEPIVWVYRVENTGDEALLNATLVDDHLGFVGSTDVLPAGGWVEWQYPGNAIEGPYQNVAVVTATTLSGSSVSATDESSYFGAAPSIALDKTTNGDDGLQIPVGSPITWQYTVSNTGNVPLDNIAVSDDQGVAPVYVSGDENGNGSLDLGEAWRYEATGVSLPGDHTNLGTVVAGCWDSAEHSAHPSASDLSSYSGVTPSTNPAISLNKTTYDGAVGRDGLVIFAGEQIMWRYDVANVGDVQLLNIHVVDDRGVVPIYRLGDVNGNGRLDTGEVWSYVAYGNATPGAYANMGTASATDGTTEVTSSDASNYTGVIGALGIQKVTIAGSLRGDDILVEAGTPVTWRYTVTNIGSAPAREVRVTDSDPAVLPLYVSGDGNGNGILDRGENWVYEATGVASAGTYANVGTLSATLFDGVDHIQARTAHDESGYIGLAPTNVAPTANGDSYGMSIDSSLGVNVPGILGNDSDPEHDPLTAVLLTGPATGTLHLAEDGSFNYVPPVGWMGTATFTYRTFDGHQYSSPATVTIRVQAAPQPTSVPASSGWSLAAMVMATGALAVGARKVSSTEN